jgi:hypothetical protein
MISIINKHYNNNNNNNNLVIICNFSINMAIKYLASNERFKYNYYVFFKEQYDDCKMVPTITWGSFYSSFCKVPNNITYKILKKLLDYANDTTIKLVKGVDSKLIEFNDDDIVDINKRIIIMNHNETISSIVAQN